ncbi:glutamate 5-kinase [Pelistega sp. NLN82]|uniref:Glutamate 5-kinase n=1 Tax=Pelistega ratti TaxID=2652177 RepID=A0A6L9Y4L4_9BURK|nr:glutamate 5-kinase [Pelistega ratti]NEN75293.1 glutamate 5-kinase [Pelistega ratti]
MSHVSLVQSAHRIVIKIGSSLITDYGKGINHQAITSWVNQIAYLRQLGKQVVLVSSGAIAEGMARLGWGQRPKEVAKLQAAASIGQMGLVQAYEKAFSSHGLLSAQILLTHEELADRLRYINARSTLFTLLELGVVPIVNENDTVVTDEIRLGDNDTLGAVVTNLIEAEALIILTDQSGLYDSDPRKNPNARFIHHAMAGDTTLEDMAGGRGSSVGTGGMITKVLAAKRAASTGAHTIIVSGQEPNVLCRLSAGEAIGTALEAQQSIRSARKQWLADHLRVKGKVVLDTGAIEAIVASGKSLLPIGVIAVIGDFMRGDLVACVDEKGQEYARGLINYDASDARRILRQPTHKLADMLGGDIHNEEMIHRNNMVVLS